MLKQFVALAAFTALAQQVPIKEIKRLSDQPILTPRSGLFDSKGAFNPAAAKIGKKTILLYRAQDDAGTSRIGRAESSDGIKFTASPKPIFDAATDYEKDGGVEDPRLQKINGKYYLTYTGYNKTDAQLCLASSTNLRDWHRLGIIMPAGKGAWNVRWTKSGAIVPEKINGRYWMYYMGDAKDGTDQMGVASSPDMVHWQDATDKPILARRPGMFDAKVVEPGPAPVITPEGILLIYNGADDKLAYRTGWVLFDKKDPTHVLRRAEVPLFQPDLTWEKNGQVPNVVFVEGMIKDGARYLLYYGGADSNVGVAEMTLAK
jgi:predicted GH43/DUF377 family glycosyl hydrolase